MKLKLLHLVFLFLVPSGCANICINGIGNCPSGGGDGGNSGGGNQPPPEAKVTQSLSVAKHPRLRIDTWQIDKWFQNGTEILTYNNCLVNFERYASLGKLDEWLPLDIEKREDIEKVERVPLYDVRIVREIEWCEGKGVFNGCTKPYGGPIIIKEDPDPLTLLHEYGHVKGLEDIKNDEKNVMFHEARPTRREINSIQCEAFKR